MFLVGSCCALQQSISDVQPRYRIGAKHQVFRWSKVANYALMCRRDGQGRMYVRSRPLSDIIFRGQDDDGGERPASIWRREEPGELLPAAFSCHRTGGGLLRAWLGGI